MALLLERNFRRFYAGYAVSVTGSAMAGVAVAFAVLSNGGNSAALGYVFAAGVIPQILLMIGGSAGRPDRPPPVMLGADLLGAPPRPRWPLRCWPGMCRCGCSSCCRRPRAPGGVLHPGADRADPADGRPVRPATRTR
jgi:hypothetical protein